MLSTMLLVHTTTVVNIGAISLQNPQTFKHKFLSYRRDLCREVKKVDLTNLFKVYVENAENVKKLAPLASTQAE